MLQFLATLSFAPQTHNRFENFAIASADRLTLSYNSFSPDYPCHDAFNLLRYFPSRFSRSLSARALEVFESWGSKQWPGPWRARGARAYNEGLGAEPPAGSRGRAPGGGSGGEAPWSWKIFSSWTFHGAAKLIPLSVLAKCSIGTWYRFTLKI